jgi:hypothetical protein
MDPAQLKAQYDQTQFLTDQISKLDRDLLKTQNHQTDTILNSQERTSYANENRANRNQQQIIDNVNDKSARIVSAVERTGGDAVLATERTASMLDTNQYRIAGQVDNSIYRTTGDINSNLFRTTAGLESSVGKVGSDSLAAIANAHNSLDTDIFRIGTNMDNSLYRAQSALQAGQAALGLESQKVTNELIGYIKSNADQSWKNFADLQRQGATDKYDMALNTTNQYAILAKQASDNLSSIQMEALKNKGDLAKQMAFEYSDLKNSIVSSESNIKDILRTQETDRLRDALRATEHKSLYFELKGHDHHGHHGRHGRHHGGHH